ncbi:MAG: cob(I)yrinic acid a,c-diamide adenosyltransferase [Deltaproteobacteria bacterium]|nr:cob(I)yrinic acid a,c-diamide adenosyltransferase [Deltaproteobacteria bacterium]
MAGQDSPRQGLIQVYTGGGKGKTTCALGLALRAVGRGLRVEIIQFMKAPQSSGEHFAAPKLAPNLEIIPTGRKGFILKKDPDPEDVRLAQAGLETAAKALEGSGVDLLILDEVNVALSVGLLKLDEVAALLDKRPSAVELVLTGRDAPAEIIERADLVTEMVQVKHPYQKGVGAREGIEF